MAGTQMAGTEMAPTEMGTSALPSARTGPARRRPARQRPGRETPSGPRTLSLAAAVNAGLRAELAADDRVLVMGEDVGTLGGVFRVTDGLAREFGAERVIDTPLAESAILGTAIGLAMRGYRPVCEIQFDGFVFPAFDQLVTQLAKLHNRSAGRVRMPVTIRIPYGGGIGAVEHHSESPEAYFCHTPGLRVLTSSTPQTAYEAVRAAVRCDDPVVLLEPKRRYWDKGEVDEGRAQLALPSSRVVRGGTDATLISYGPRVRTCLDAAEAAEADGRSLEVLELQMLSPLDVRPLVESAERTGRVVIVAEAPRSGSLAAEIAASLTEEAYYSLEAPVLRVSGFDVPYPASRLERHHLPDVDRVLDAVDRAFGY